MPIQSVFLLSRPFQKGVANLIGPLVLSRRGFKYILSFVDVCTRPECIALRIISAESLAEALMSIFCCVRFPKVILSDYGSSSYLRL